MAIEVACPNCQSKLKAPDGMAGRKARCKKCSTSFVIPGVPVESVAGAAAAPGSVEAPFSDLTAKPAAPKPAPVEPVAEERPFADFSAKSATVPKPKAAEPAPVEAPAPVAEAAPKAVAAKPKPAPGKKPAAPVEPESNPEALPFDDDEPANDTGIETGSETGFDFSAPSHSPPVAKGASKGSLKPKAKAPAPAPAAPPAAAPAAAPTGDDPFSLASLLTPDEPHAKGKAVAAAKGAEPAEDGVGRRYRGPERGGSKILLVAALLGVVALCGGVGAVITILNVKKRDAEIRKQEEETRAAAQNPPAPPPVEAPVQVPAPPGAQVATPAPVAAVPAPAPMAPKPVPEEPAKTATPPAKTPTPPAKTPTPPAKTPTPAPAAKPPTPPAKPATPPAKAATPPAKPDTKTAPPKGAMVIPPNTQTFKLSPTATSALEMGNQAASRGLLDAPFAAVRRLFPAEEDGERFAVLWQSAEGSFGKPQKLTLDRYFQGERQGRLVVEGNGKPPVCDLSPDALRFAHAVDGKLTVYEVNEGEKVAPTWELYGRPEFAPLRTGGVVAVHFAANPAIIATVAAAGPIHLWEVKTARLLGEFSPTPAGTLDARAVTVDDKRAHLVIAVGGVVHAIPLPRTVPNAPAAGDNSPTAKLTAKSQPLGGNARVLALGQQNGSDNRLLVVVETLDAKKEKAVLRFKLGRDKPAIYKWPKEAGEPVFAAWPSTFIGVVATDKGTALLFDDEQEDRFFAAAHVVPAAMKGLQVPTRGLEKHWIALPDPAAENKTLIASSEMPFDGYSTLDSTKAVVALQPKVK